MNLSFKYASIKWTSLLCFVLVFILYRSAHSKISISSTKLSIPDIALGKYVNRSDLFVISHDYRSLSNFYSRYTNGNRNNKKGIKIAHWNGGNSSMVSKIPEID